MPCKSMCFGQHGGGSGSDRNTVITSTSVQGLAVSKININQISSVDLNVSLILPVMDEKQIFEWLWGMGGGGGLCVGAHMCVHVHACVCVFVCMCQCVCWCMCMHACVFACVCVCVHGCICFMHMQFMKLKWVHITTCCLSVLYSAILCSQADPLPVSDSLFLAKNDHLGFSKFSCEQLLLSFA